MTVTLVQLAKMRGVSYRTLQKWVRREDNPLPSTLVLSEGGGWLRVVKLSDFDSYKRPQMGGKR